MPESQRGFFAVALSREVVITSLRVALFVGTILGIINHGGAILELSLTPARLLQVVLTYSVPYCVSTYSMVKAIRMDSVQRT